MGAVCRAAGGAAPWPRRWAVAVALALSLGPVPAASAPARKVPVQRPKNLKPPPAQTPDEAPAPGEDVAGPRPDEARPAAAGPASPPTGPGPTVTPFAEEPPPPRVKPFAEGAPRATQGGPPEPAGAAVPVEPDRGPTGAALGHRRFVRGTAPLIAGSVIGGTFLLFRDVLLATEIASVAGLGGVTDVVPDGLVPIVTVPSQVLLLVVPAGLVAAGAYLRGRAAAFARPPGRLARPALRRRAAAGWAMFGLGIGLLAAEVGVLAAWSPGLLAQSRNFALAHLGLALTGTGFVVGGVATGPYASGLLRGLRERARSGAGIVVVPQLSSTGGGIHVAGRW